MTRKITLIIIALLAAATALGREIKGRIIGEGGAPLDFVNVVLYRDSTYITGTITDTEGKFIIATEAAWKLSARISSVGYETLSAAVPSSGNFGTVELKPTAVALGEVVVKASRPSTTLKGNSLVTSVAGSGLALAGTANDVLVRVPMVIDNGGALEVFGKGQPAIYINGRRLTDLQELSQLNSQDIKDVELITNPGAEYSAEVKSVIRLRTKPPKGDGWSGTLRTDNGFMQDFRTGNSIDLKYRTRGIEIFANYGWWHGYDRTDRADDMSTSVANGKILQKIHTYWKERYNDMNGKIGFSWLINDRHSIGAYYRNGCNRHSMTGSTPTEVWQDGTLAELIETSMAASSNSVPMHSANIYYNGSAGRLGIDFNADYLRTKQRQTSLNNEAAELGSDRIVNTASTARNRMFAEKLVLSYPLWQGQLKVGQEYTDTRSTNLFTSDIAETGNSDSRVDEHNIAAFAEFARSFGRYNIGVGLRYEHVDYDYFEKVEHQLSQSKTYNNFFPSINVSTQIGRVRMALNYTSKTVRPGYGQLDGAISYINRLTYETGNPYLKPTKLHTVEYMAQWRNFFAQISYSCINDGVYHITEPFGNEGMATIIKTENLSWRHYLRAFAGAQFSAGIWQPQVNAGVTKQWLTLPVDGTPTKMNTPGFMIQWQNALHLPLDIWLNIDAQLMTSTWDTNMKLTNTPWYINAKLYKGFLNNSLSVTLEAKDLFNSAARNMRLCSDAVQIMQTNYSKGRSVMLTLQFRFNTTRDRYRGTGAGNAEKSRF